MEKTPYAIIETGGKQFRVEPSQVIDVERLTLGKEAQEIVLDKVLLASKGDSVAIGTPYLAGAKVLCEYVGEEQGPKVISFKIRRRKNYRKKIGHRQLFSRLRVKEIHFKD